jgi:hypothetical protein
MTEAEELAWLRDWRTRLISGMRLWSNPPDYRAACRAWTQVAAVLNEQPPSINHIPKGKEPTTC